MRLQKHSAGLLALLGILLALPEAAHPESIEEKAQICSGCHGEAGIPQEKTTPIIWGQSEGYLYLNLRDFKRGARKNDLMSPVAATLTKEDMKALAAFFAQKKWPLLDHPSPPKDISKRALAAIGSVGCTSCHLDKFQGSGTTPRLAGQSQAYLKKTMMDFRDRSRANNPGMSDLMNSIQPDDIDAISQYLASQQVLQGGQ